MQLTILRHRAICRSCQSKLLPRTEAWLDDEQGEAVCVSCVRFGELDPTAPPSAPAAPEAPTGPTSSAGERPAEGAAPRRVPKRVPVRVPGPPTPPESTAWTAAAARFAAAAARDDAGSTARVDGTPPRLDGAPPRLEGDPPAAPADPAPPPPAAEHRPNLRLVASNPSPEHSDRPHHGALLLAVDDKGTELVDRGDAGEGRVGQTLEGARVHGLEVLHHRRVPSSVVGIDHIVIAVNGIWVIDASQRLDGKLERRDTGDWFTAHPRLYIAGNDRTSLIDGVQAQVAAVKSVLQGSPYADAPVYGVLCFEAALEGWVREPFTLNGVSVTWRRHLVEPMLAPFQFDPASRAELTRFLAVQAPAA